MNEYSPFNKQIHQLTAADLVGLREVRESWYVEYKSEVPNASSIAKSISAFSNTYGGWLFYGVQEKVKDDPVAGEFPGIARSEIEGARHRIRQAVANYLEPLPHFDIEVLYGPCEEIALSNDRAIICIRVSRSSTTPHVHKSGQIYRRVADGSEPKAESDRFVLDQLWRRADDIRQKYKRWIEKDPEFSETEAEISYLRLMIVPDLWADHNIRLNLNIQEIREIMQSDKGGVQVPFETVYTSSNGWIARQLLGNLPHNLGLTWQLLPDLSSEILFPINRFKVDNVRMTEYELVGFSQAARYSQILRAQKYQRVTILDLNFLFNLLVGVVRIQQRFCEKAGWTEPWFIKARLLNVWRTSPFIDLDVVIDLLETHGIPMCLNKNVTIPAGFDPESFMSIETFDEIENPEVRSMVKAAIIFSLIAKALGIPGWLEPGTKGEGWFFHTELLQVGNRATEAQKQRNERKKNSAVTE
jgi:hypothetical protein